MYLSTNIKIILSCFSKVILENKYIYIDTFEKAAFGTLVARAISYMSYKQVQLLETFSTEVSKQRKSKFSILNQLRSRNSKNINVEYEKLFSSK